MRESLTAFAVGIAFGMVCRAFGAPIPAPSHYNGVIAIAGVFCGFSLFWRLV